METTTVCGAYIGVMEKTMETTTVVAGPCLGLLL